MSLWKVLGGAALGVVAIAALPVAGPIGAITAIGAAVAGTAGGVAGAVVSDSDKEEGKKEGEITGREKEKTKFALREAKLIEAFKKAQENDKKYFDLLVAMYAIGMATANADGEITKEELNDIDEFVAGVGASQLPPHIKSIINELRKNPPSFNTAMYYVKQADNPDPQLFETVIEVVSASDGYIAEEEKALLLAYRDAVSL